MKLYIHINTNYYDHNSDYSRNIDSTNLALKKTTLRIKDFTRKYLYCINPSNIALMILYLGEIKRKAELRQKMWFTRILSAFLTTASLPAVSQSSTRYGLHNYTNQLLIVSNLWNYYSELNFPTVPLLFLWWHFSLQSLKATNYLCNCNIPVKM